MPRQSLRQVNRECRLSALRATERRSKARDHAVGDFLSFVALMAACVVLAALTGYVVVAL